MTKQEFLAISLPYGLICDRIFYDIEELGKESGIHIIDGFDYEIYSDGDIFDLKPILHPLTYLTKEIEHNGKKFVPIVELAKISYPERYVSLYVYRDGIIRAEIDFEDYYVHLYFDGKDFVSDSSIQNQFKLFQKLIEWHFDIAGLIEKGEAIDVNTLPENPYK